jgi:hypothetical protein
MGKLRKSIKKVRIKDLSIRTQDIPKSWVSRYRRFGGVSYVYVTN